ncbi:GGDEF domain-containing protein [Frankia sp. AgB1.9]|uniref:GGDEF domain-containing protein n=1 Tax=unclassified Frankia TaxID=2632575 RepID=UPI001932C4F8|nr:MULTISPECIES: GGDEF domain-containing protein [unclassified Frankia]MBL7487669.1 GGDEF domain-containing protein [Frankia sp. AgW1.1]MBL7550047.1 GGDEF domain-containing protein [Frankia sp. AgB1.9]MBL7621758.1 GGDEF domain-containing protein [Frankia sp. AgB1.8]
MSREEAPSPRRSEPAEAGAGRLPAEPRWVVVLGVLYVASYLSAVLVASGQADRIVRIASATGASLLIGGYCAWCGLRTRHEERVWRLLLAAAGGTATLGSAIALAYVVARGAPPANISLVDLGYFLTPLLSLCAIIVLPTDAAGRGPEPTDRHRHHRWRLVIVLDGLLITGSATLLCWSAALRPIVEARSSGLSPYLVVRFSINVLIVVLLLLVACFRRARDPQTQALLTVSFVAFGVAQWLALTKVATPDQFFGFGVTTAYIIGCVILGLAVGRHPSRAGPAAARPELANLWPRLLLPYLPLVMLLGLSAARIVTGAALIRNEIGFTLVLVCLVIVRQLITALDNVRLLSRVRAGQRQLRHLAYHDALTGLPNRARLNEHLAAALTRRTGGLALLMCDLDDFKAVNDTLGHDAGDELLRATAGRLLECVGPPNLVARLGGDEFAVLVEDPSDDPDVIGARIGARMTDPVALNGEDRVVHVSVGVARLTQGEAAVPATLLRRADAAMYATKRSRKAASSRPPAAEEGPPTRGRRLRQAGRPRRGHMSRGP